MQAVFVESSNIERVGYHRKTLFIEFKNGICYAYKNVSHSQFQALVSAESVGQHFNRWIKPNFEYVKLTDNPFTQRASELHTEHLKFSQQLA